jgi:hypothetical protein
MIRMWYQGCTLPDETSLTTQQNGRVSQHSGTVCTGSLQVERSGTTRAAKRGSVLRICRFRLEGFTAGPRLLDPPSGCTKGVTLEGDKPRHLHAPSYIVVAVVAVVVVVVVVVVLV